MAAPIALRDDYDGASLRRLARSSDDANQTRRLLALGVIYDGGLRGVAAEVGGVGPQVIRDWVLRFNARGPAGLIDVTHPGPKPKLNAEQRGALVRRVEAGPKPAVDGVVRWRLKDLVAWVRADYGITLDETTLGRTLRALGYRKLSARARHYAQDPEAAEAFKKTSPRPSQHSAGPCRRAAR